MQYRMYIQLQCICRLQCTDEWHDDNCVEQGGMMGSSDYIKQMTMRSKVVIMRSKVVTMRSKVVTMRSKVVTMRSKG